MEAVSTALVTGLGSIATDAADLVSKIFPVVLPIIGAVVLVTFGLKVFRRFTGTR